VPLNEIRVYGELSFNHRMIQSTTTSSSLPTIVTGRLDYSIGRVLAGTGGNIQLQRNRRFQSCLVIVKAKMKDTMSSGLAQLLAYLACLRQSRIRRHRTNSSVYGVASDGYAFVFVTITDDGSVKRSRVFDVRFGEMEKVLQCLRYILEQTTSMSQNTTPEKKGGHEEVVDHDDHDDSIEIGDDVEYSTPDEGDDVL